MNTHNFAWAAGFFDGEGCTYLRRSAKYNWKTVELRVSQKDTRVFDKWGATFPVGNYYCDDNGYTKWVCAGFENVQQIMIFMWPYLGDAKKEQYVNKVREYLRSRKNTRSYHHRKKIDRKFTKVYLGEEY